MGMSIYGPVYDLSAWVWPLVLFIRFGHTFSPNGSRAARTPPTSAPFRESRVS